MFIALESNHIKRIDINHPNDVDSKCFTDLHFTEPKFVNLKKEITVLWQDY